ncbi:hypothetical protein RQP46_003393 [Phenoliferia psychrophenolica]
MERLKGKAGGHQLIQISSSAPAPPPHRSTQANAAQRRVAYASISALSFLTLSSVATTTWTPLLLALVPAQLLALAILSGVRELQGGRQLSLRGAYDERSRTLAYGASLAIGGFAGIWAARSVHPIVFISLETVSISLSFLENREQVSTRLRPIAALAVPTLSGALLLHTAAPVGGVTLVVLQSVLEHYRKRLARTHDNSSQFLVGATSVAFFLSLLVYWVISFTSTFDDPWPFDIDLLDALRCVTFVFASAYVHLASVITLPFTSPTDFALLIAPRNLIFTVLWSMAPGRIWSLVGLWLPLVAYLHHILTRYNASIAALQGALATNPLQLQVSDPHGLAAHTIFITGDGSSWGSAARRRLELLSPGTGFLSFGPHAATQCGFDSWGTEEFPFFKQLFNAFRGDLCPTDGWQTTSWSGQFAVSRRRILAVPYQQLQSLQDLLEAPEKHWIKLERREPIESELAAVPIKFTTFQVIGFLNGKNVASNFVKNDAQNWWSRREPEEEWDKARDGKRRKLIADDDELVQATNDGTVINPLTAAPAALVRPPKAPKEAPDAPEGVIDPTTKTIVIHPGSRWLRIGRASDAFPLSVPNVIASRTGAPINPKGKSVDRSSPPAPTPASAPAATHVHTTSTGTSLHIKLPALPPLPPIDQDGDADMLDSDDDNSDDEDDDEDKPAVDPSAPVDPVAAKISSIRGDLRARMRVFKLRGQGNGNSQAAAYNASVVPEPTPDYNDPSEVTWTDVKGPDAKPYYVGHEALAIPDAEQMGYTIRRPYDRGVFNTKDYTSQQELLGDIERIWLTTLEEELEITKEELKDYSAILIIPDLYDHIYIREMTDLVLKWIGFKQLCLQQESICAMFGAGLSSACVIDIGAKKTSISCIEEGLILPETRMVLDFAGDDITEFLHTLLLRTNFPYRDADLTRWHDFTLMEELKERMVVLSEGDVGLNIYDFYVRSPHKSTVKYMLRCYDDVILAPYALFAPRVVEFDKKTTPPPNHLWSRDVEDIIDIGGYATTNAMKNSTKHLLPAAPLLPALPPLPSLDVLNDNHTEDGATPLRGSPAPVPAPVVPVVPTATIDVRREAGKIPLDVAVVESILAAGTEDRMKRVCQNVLIVGGTGAIHNIGFAVESRVSPALSARVPSLYGQLAIVPPPREIDPRILAWKGISVLSKLDGAADLWIRREDWEALGMRAVKERAFYFA